MDKTKQKLIWIDTDIHRKLKILAAIKNTTFSNVVRLLLKEAEKSDAVKNCG